MSKQIKFENAKKIPLADIIPTKRFRIVNSEQKDIPGGITESFVTIDIKPKFSKTLDFKTSASGRIYGFVRIGRGADKPKKIELVDWGDEFLMLVHTNGDDEAFSVSSEEVKELLNNCLRPK